MTPERIAMVFCGRHYDFPLRPQPGEFPELCGELGIACPSCLRAHIAKLDAALESAQAEIAQLSEARRVVPKSVSEAALDFIADDVRFVWDPWSEEHDMAVRLYHEWLLKSCDTIPADRALKDGEISMTREDISAAFKAGFDFSKDWRNFPSNSEYVNELFRLRTAQAKGVEG